jgi:hypothetical protein
MLLRTNSSLTLVLTAVNAAVYAGLGILWVTFPVTVFGIRLWPQVFAPAAFAVLFGPWVGGVGAAIGIFLADVIYGHHDALLSFLVGVPANLVGFSLVGYIARRQFQKNQERALLIASLLVPVLLAAMGISLLSSGGAGGLSLLLIGLIAASAIVAVALPLLLLRMLAWTKFAIAASIGLAAGSLIIGVGIVLYSSIFALPAVLGLGSAPLPIAFVYGATAFTYLSEILFLVLITPPVIWAVRTALPSLVAPFRRQS